MHPQFRDMFEHYPGVPEEMQEAFWNYLAYGLDPGNFGTSVLLNNFTRAVCSAHSGIDPNGLRSIAKWFINCVPDIAWGNREAVNSWRALSDQDRLDIMIERRMRPSEFDILRGIAVA